MPQPVIVAAVQMDVRFGDVSGNLRRIEEFTRRAAAGGAGLVVFPECALTGYCFESLDEAAPLAEEIPGPSTLRLASLCRELDVFVVAGMLEREQQRIYNACGVAGPSGVLASYRKIHLPHLGVDRFVTPGDRPLGVWEAGEMRFGVNICYDGSFPESARVMTLLGADLIVLPTNWPAGSECTAQFVIPARAIENTIYYLACNRVGVERGFGFIGESKICDPQGRALAQAPGDGEHVLMAEIDLQVARTKRLVRVEGKHEINRIADRRPEFYGEITRPTRRS